MNLQGTSLQCRKWTANFQELAWTTIMSSWMLRLKVFLEWLAWQKTSQLFINGSENARVLEEYEANEAEILSACEHHDPSSATQRKFQQDVKNYWLHQLRTFVALLLTTALICMHWTLSWWHLKKPSKISIKRWLPVTNRCKFYKQDLLNRKVCITDTIAANE